ncbi:MAG: hypothetical protein K0R81_1099 [Microbacterium sp.]|nr:hypothetical protein [Microbacterium sp.]
MQGYFIPAVRTITRAGATTVKVPNATREGTKSGVRGRVPWNLIPDNGRCTAAVQRKDGRLTREEPATIQATGPSRRTIIAGAAWSVPVIAMMSTSPAFANSLNAVVSLTLATGAYLPTSGATGVTVRVVDSQNKPLAGASVSLTGPSSAVFATPTGTTDGSGSFSTTVDLRTPWATPGSAVTLTATGAGATGTTGPVLTGANLLALGAAYGSSPAQAEKVFPSPVIQALSSLNFSVVLLENGSVWTSGKNNSGQLGNGTTTDRSTWGVVPGLADVKQISAGRDGVYARLADGTVRAWGANDAGQIGDGTTTVRLVPTTVSGVSGVTQVHGGAQSGYALLSDGTVKAWGSNSVGQLGDGTTTDRPTPVISAASGVVALAGSNRSVFALGSDGSVWAWGQNDRGQAATGSLASPVTSPSAIPGLSSVVQISGGRESGVALLSDGTVRTWGMNNRSQLGNGATTDSSTPVTVTGLSGVTAVASAGLSVFALRNDHSIAAWGANDGGRLGDGTTADRSTPVTVQGLGSQVVAHLMESNGQSNAVFFVVGQQSLAVTAAPSLLAAGSDASIVATVTATGVGVAGKTVSFASTNGASLSSTSGPSDSAGRVSTILTPSPWTTPGSTVLVSAISDAGEARQALTVTGSNVLGVGGAYGGGLKQTERVFPSPVVEAMSGQGFSVVRLQDGTVWTVGENGLGQLGDGTTTTRTTWAAVPGVSGVVGIAVGIQHVLALTSDGSVWAWGDGDSGQIGDGSTGGRTSPVRVPNISAITQVQAGGTNSYALKSDGTVWAWGYNHIGQLGNGTAQAAASPSPTQVQNISTGSVLLSANWTIFVQLHDGSYVAWGQNDHGQIGDGTTTDRHLPTAALTGMTNIKKLTFGRASGYALLNDGTVSAWGMNEHGQCGNGTTTDVLTPAAVTGLSNVKDVIGAGRNGFALLNDGTLKAWGWNAQGQTGDGSSGNDRLTPVSVVVPAEASSLALLPGNKQDHSVFIGAAFAEVSGSNLALTATATASSTFSFRAPSFVNDGNPSTRWASDYNSATPDNQWLLLDFGGQRQLSRVVIKWEAASAKEYVVELSSDGATWSAIYSTSTGAGGNVDIPFATTSARYIRMTGTKRNTSAGYSIWELEAYA